MIHSHMDSRVLTCAHCNRQKPLSQFSTAEQKKAQKGYKPTCLDCVRKEKKR